MAIEKKSTTQTAIKPKTDREIAGLLTSPTVQAAITIQQWQGAGTEINALVDVLSSQIDQVYEGNMNRPEAMLLAQAHTLDELFNNLARRAHDQEQMKHYETFLRMALKAQGQCRATLETLAAIKTPPIIFAKQANIANGHQQINNGISASATHAEEIKNQPNELLEAQHGSTTLDTGTTSTTIGKDKAMAALE
ncbi:hypothetical protein [Methylobacter sp.]